MERIFEYNVKFKSDHIDACAIAYSDDNTIVVECYATEDDLSDLTLIGGNGKEYLMQLTKNLAKARR